MKRAHRTIEETKSMKIIYTKYVTSQNLYDVTWTIFELAESACMASSNGIFIEKHYNRSSTINVCVNNM